MDEVELLRWEEVWGRRRGEPTGDSTAVSIAVEVTGDILGDWGCCLGKLAEWTGARHKKVVGLRMVGETVFWTEDILVVVFGMRIAGGKKFFL
jgi:hypothetical protein